MKRIKNYSQQIRLGGARHEATVVRNPSVGGLDYANISSPFLKIK
jgi:hypothetical protein